MKTLLVGALVVCATVTAAGAEVTFIEAEHGEQPDHLVPHATYLQSYDKRIAKHLFVTAAEHGRMVVRPSFSGEASFAVHETASKEVLDRHSGLMFLVPNDQKKFLITVTRATESLWYSMAENDHEKELKKVEIQRFDAEIPASLAVAIQRAWVRMLQRTRYPARGYQGLDGTTYQFSVFVRGLGDLEGEIWSPTSSLPARMVELGEELMSLAQAKRVITEKDAAELVGKLRRFESVCESNPAPGKKGD